MYFLGGTILPTRFIENMYCAMGIMLIREDNYTIRFLILLVDTHYCTGDKPLKQTYHGWKARYYR